MLMDTDVGKDRLDNREPPRIDLLALLAVDLGFHQIDQVRLAAIDLREVSDLLKQRERSGQMAQSSVRA
jgi:hypothetical protein